jgi:hypothetical protein
VTDTVASSGVCSSCSRRTAEQDKDLADPEVDTFFEVAEAEIGTTGLLSGWAIVAAFLRKRLIVDAAT